MSTLEQRADAVVSTLASAVEKHPMAANAPGILATMWAWFTDLPLNQIIALLTIVWLSLQITAFVWVRVRGVFKGKS